VEATKADLPSSSSDESKAQWVKPEVSRIVAGAAEAGDNFSGEGGNSYS
jgi:hypothetical protein